MNRTTPNLMWIFLFCSSLLLSLMPASGVAMNQPLTITLERSNDGDPHSVVLKATVKNVSQRNITIGVGGPLMDYEVIVTNARGIPVPLSKRGREVFSKNQIRSTMYVAVTLTPGETRVDTWAITDFFDFAKPGSYLVTVKRKIGGWNAVQLATSNALEVNLN